MTNMYFKKKTEQERDLFQQLLDLIQEKALKHFPENPQRTEMELIALERALTQALQGGMSWINFLCDWL